MIVMAVFFLDFFQAAYNFIKQQDWPFWTNLCDMLICLFFFDFYEDFNNVLLCIYKNYILQFGIQIWNVTTEVKVKFLTGFLMLQVQSLVR